LPDLEISIEQNFLTKRPADVDSSNQMLCFLGLGIVALEHVMAFVRIVKASCIFVMAIISRYLK
jgi:hypothetical protein